MENVYDVAIIGSGPAGLTAAIYCSRANLKTLVLAGTKWGGQLMLTTTVENFPGFPDGVEGPQLMENMKKQALRFGAKIVNENCTECHPELVSGSRPETAGVSNQMLKQVQHDNEFVVKTTNSEYRSRAIIIATGAEVKWLELENEQRLIGHGVSSCAPCDA
ncbi:MAG: FAD-dependent oxidoreductase, partial [Patescibacteria group bacterium]